MCECDCTLERSCEDAVENIPDELFTLPKPTGLNQVKICFTLSWRRHMVRQLLLPLITCGDGMNPGDRLTVRLYTVIVKSSTRY